MVNVPAVLILVPFNWRALVALIVATVSVAELPLSTKVNRVFGEASASLIESVPLVPAVAILTLGPDAVSASGDELDRVTTPDALIVVAPATLPVLVIPPLLLLILPVTDKPPLEIVWIAVKVLA